MRGGLRRGCAGIPALRVTTPDTNIVWVRSRLSSCAGFTDFLGGRGFGITGGYGKAQQRWVTHLDVRPRRRRRAGDRRGRSVFG